MGVQCVRRSTENGRWGWCGYANRWIGCRGVNHNSQYGQGKLEPAETFDSLGDQPLSRAGVVSSAHCNAGQTAASGLAGLGWGGRVTNKHHPSIPTTPSRGRQHYQHVHAAIRLGCEGTTPVIKCLSILKTRYACTSNFAAIFLLSQSRIRTRGRPVSSGACRCTHNLILDAPMSPGLAWSGCLDPAAPPGPIFLLA